MAETKTDDVANHFLAMELVPMAAILDAKSGPEGVALKKAVSFLAAQVALSWARAQNEGKGIAPPRRKCASSPFLALFFVQKTASFFWPLSFRSQNNLRLGDVRM